MGECYLASNAGNLRELLGLQQKEEAMRDGVFHCPKCQNHNLILSQKADVMGVWEGRCTVCQFHFADNETDIDLACPDCDCKALKLHENLRGKGYWFVCPVCKDDKFSIIL